MPVTGRVAELEPTYSTPRGGVALTWFGKISGMGTRRAIKRRLLWCGAGAIAVWLLALALVGGWDVADPIASVVGALAGTAALSYALVAPLDTEQLAGRLAGEVVRREQGEYVRWLDGSIGGRIDLAYTVHAHGHVEGTQPEGRLGDLTALQGRFSPPRMVITGGDVNDDAGTGKSLAALSMVLDLTRDRQSGQAVALRIAATSWTGQDLEEWLTGHLATTFGVGGGPARRLVEARLVLPVIDGLDELDQPGTAPYSSRAAELLRMLNGWQHGTQPAAVVLTCRRGVYDGLTRAEAHLRAAAVVRLAPVTGEQSRAYLQRSVADTEAGLNRWQPVLEALATDLREDQSPQTSSAMVRLRQALATPWRLALAVAVYQERTVEGHYRRDPADLLSLAESGTLRQYLLDLYIPAVLAVREDGAIHHEGPARRWLAVLASYLNDNRDGRQADGRTLSSTDLVLPELWPMVGVQRTKRAIRCTGLLWAGAIQITVVVRAAALGSWGELAFSFGPLFAAVCVLSPDLWDRGARIVLRTGRFALGFALPFVLIMVLGWYFPWGSTADMARTAAHTGLLIGVSMGIAFTSDPRRAGPHALVRREAISFFLYMGVLTIAALLSDLSVALVTTAIFGAVMVNTTSFRYMVFLVLARRLLPWRLGRFLKACHQAGILRTAGAAYQFRHRELQDHLAIRRPEDGPSTPRACWESR
jgi:hypothetical protein